MAVGSGSDNAVTPDREPETGIAAGVRRIEALTGEAARQFLLAQAGVAKSLAQSFKVQTADVPARVESARGGATGALSHGSTQARVEIELSEIALPDRAH